MSNAYKIMGPHGVYFLTFQVVDRVAMFSEKLNREIIVAPNWFSKY